MILTLLWVILCAMPQSSLAAEEASVSLYSEQLIACPSGFSAITSMSIASDGSIVAVARDDTLAWYRLTWRDTGAEPTIQRLTFEGNISSISMAPDGQMMVVLSPDYTQMFNNGTPNTRGSGNANSASNGATGGALPDGPGSGGNGAMNILGGNGSTSVVWLDADGVEVSRLNISSFGSSMAALSNRQVVVSSGMMGGGVTIYDDKGEQVRTLDANDAIDIAVRDDSVFVLTSESVIEYSAATGSRITSYAVNAGYQGRIAAGLDGRIYVNANEGLYWIEPAHGVAEKCMNVSSTILGDPSSTLSGFGALSDGTIVALVTNGSGGLTNLVGGRVQLQMAGATTSSTFAAYKRLDATSSGNTLKITSMYDSVILRKAVSIFARQHPEIEVSVQIESPDGDTTPIADHIRTLNTDLLAGKGGDVLILDDMPLSGYISKGVLKDITRLADELGLTPGIRAGSQAPDGKVYAVPAQFAFGTLWGRTDVLGGKSSLTDLENANLAAGQSPFSARTPKEWLTLFYPASQESFRDDKGIIQFNTPKFEAFLEALYELYTSQGEMSQLSMPNLRGGGNFGRSGINPQEMLALYNGSAAYTSLTITSLMSLSTVYSLAGGEDSSVILTPGIDGPANTYKPVNIVGVNARSTMQAYAEEFIRILFSKEAQESDTFNALPTTSEELDAQFQSARERSEDGVMMRVSAPGGVNIEIVQPSEEAWRYLRTLCDEVTNPVTVDDTLMGFLVEETANFFEGRESAAQAAQALQQRAWFYLNE